MKSPFIPVCFSKNVLWEELFRLKKTLKLLRNNLQNIIALSVRIDFFTQDLPRISSSTI